MEEAHTLPPRALGVTQPALALPCHRHFDALASAPKTHRVLRGLRRISPPDTWLKLVSDDAHGTQQRPGCRCKTTCTYTLEFFHSFIPEISPAIPKHRCEFDVLNKTAADNTTMPQKNSCTEGITRYMTDTRAGRGLSCQDFPLHRCLLAAAQTEITCAAQVLCQITSCPCHLPIFSLMPAWDSLLHLSLIPCHHL